ncbi:MAG: hypothetical protein ASARMPRED_004999 [Alectoria sarmentosa]|nr:MAG: hypothetical protein ASARMPRED_004999 [Alectoria sarmentosa]
MAMTYIPEGSTREGSIREESPRDTPPSSEICICKEQPSTTEISFSKEGPTTTEISISKEQPSVEQNYAVEKLNDKDDAGYVRSWKVRVNQLLPFTSLTAICSYWLYFAFRVRYTVAAQRLKHTVYPVAWLFLSIELGVALPVLLTQMLQCLSIKPRHRPRLRVVGEHVPMVDVFITCAGEETEVILDTLRAAAGVDWPRDKMRIIVLDDKKSDEVRREVELIGLENSSIHYSARTKIKGMPHHFKAGNLNGGLKYVSTLEGEKAEFVAALDADMIVESFWLRAIISHLITDPQLALACPPQLFYNVPKNDPLYQNLALFFGILEAVKDSIGSAWCTGSGYAIRRSALDQIGGFPIGSVAEDVYCSNLLLGAGWKTCYVHEPLQWGTVPDSFSGHIKQRARWTIGTVQTAAKLNFFLYGRIYHAVAIVRSFVLPSWLGGAMASFASSGSIDSVINERDARTRAPLVRRLRVILLNGGVLIHVMYILFTAAAVAASLVRTFTTTADAWQDRLFYVLTHAGWPPLVWLVASVACTVPIKYAVDPPAMPDREDLLQRDKDTLIAHPTEGAKRARWGKSNLLHEGFYVLITAYTTAIFFGSWFVQ